MEELKLETDREVAECFVTRFTVPELRKLASNVAVSRERGDTKIQTAVRITEQAPGVAAAIVENDPEIPIDASAFKKRREVDEETITLDEAARRAKNKKTFYKLKHLKNAVAHVAECYEAEVEWEVFGPGSLTSITVKPRDDWETNPLLKERVHIILSQHGKVSHPDEIAKADKPSRQFRLLCGRIENWWCS